jgi:hypothetical protein
MKSTHEISKLEELLDEPISPAHFFARLCVEGKWKYDLEESDLMIGFSRTWRKEGMKAWLYFSDYLNAPPLEEYDCQFIKLEIGKIDSSKLTPENESYTVNGNPQTR